MVGRCLEDFLQCPTIVFLSDKIKYNSSLQIYITFVFAPVIIVLLKPSAVSGSGKDSITGICAGRTFNNSRMIMFAFRLFKLSKTEVALLILNRRIRPRIPK